MKDQIFKERLLEEEAITVGQVITSDPIIFGENPHKAGRHGNLSAWVNISAGAGTIKLEALCSCNEVDYVAVPVVLTSGSATEIIATQGLGQALVGFAIPLCTHLKIRLTEDGGGTLTVKELYIMSR